MAASACRGRSTLPTPWLATSPAGRKAKIDAAIAAGKTMRVPLPRKIPVHLIYATAFEGPLGIEFRPDVYGRDRKLYAALFGKPAS